jgi:hypothetical protein
MFSCSAPAPKDTNPEKDALLKDKRNSVADTLSGKAVKLDYNKLVGNWVRTDGGYELEINSATPSGKIEAGYFNPNPIHVGRAEWVGKNNSLIIIVELQDKNYPGSTYTLEFLPSEDKLIGNYFQAVEGVNFDVEFVRIK